MGWVSPFDRVQLSELLQTYRDEVRELAYDLKDEIGDAGNGFIDDVWLLRYVLGFERGTGRIRPEAAKKAIEWRRENGDLIAAAKHHDPTGLFSLKDLAAFDAFFIGRVQCVSKFGDPLYVARAGACNIPELLDVVGEKKMELWLNFLNEMTWQHCEAATREKGFFVKQITVSDFLNLTMGKIRPFMNVLGNSSKMNDWLRPLMAGKTVIFNLPSWLRLVSKAAKAFMSKKTIERLEIPGSYEDLCSFVKKLVDTDCKTLPSFLGGSCDCENTFPLEARTVFRNFENGETPASVGDRIFSTLPCLHKSVNLAQDHSATSVPAFTQCITEIACAHRCSDEVADDEWYTPPSSPPASPPRVLRFFTADELEPLNESGSNKMVEYAWWFLPFSRQLECFSGCVCRRQASNGSSGIRGLCWAESKRTEGVSKNQTKSEGHRQ